MKRKKYLFSLFIIQFLIISLPCILITKGESKTLIKEIPDLIVDINGNGDFFSIQAAINIAPEKTTIYVKSGTYHEILDIKKEIFLIGQDEENTFINPISEKNKYAVRLGAPGIKIKKLTIINGAPGLYTTGIKIVNNNIKIENCNMYSTPIGIAIWSSENIIKNCIFSNCNDEGIVLIGSKYSKCTNNEIINCSFYQNCDGIELQYSSYNLIKNCTFNNNTHSGIDAIGSSNDYNYISNCIIKDNQVHGIYLSKSSNNIIKNCTIYNNKDGNIIITDDSLNNQINIIPTSEYQEDKENQMIKQSKLILKDNLYITQLNKDIYYKILSFFNKIQTLFSSIIINFE